jgi:RNA-directed DNA polymerase
MSMRQAMRQTPVQTGRVGVAGGESARRTPASDEACGPRDESGDTGSALLEAALTRTRDTQLRKTIESQGGSGMTSHTER